jgi:mono/diheme cytochrome c family protein
MLIESVLEREELRMKRTFVSLVLALVVTPAIAQPEPTNPRSIALPAAIPAIRTLEQNWSDAESNWFYNAPQGSRLIPYEWAVHLEQPGSTARFFDAANTRKFGFIARNPAPDNPDGMPIGFVKDAPYDDGTEGLGVTCAACHTGIITYQKTAFLIDGAPTLGDMETLLRELAQSLRATAQQDDKFARFASRILGPASSRDEQLDLREAVRSVAKQRADYNARNMSHGPAPRFGPGRIDAFGAIFNEVSATFLGIPENARPANAPVSFPCLWDAPQHDRVQWNGAAINRKSPLGLALFGTQDVGALGRNTGEVLGVFGSATINEHELVLPRRYEATANKPNLLALEETLTTLWSPRWPDAFGAPDPASVDRGAELYQAHCVSCHAEIQRDDPRRQVTAKLSDVQTDPMMLRNFGRVGKTGMLERRSKTLLELGRFQDEAPVAMILKHVVERVMLDPLQLKQLRSVLDSADKDSKPVNPGFESTVEITVGDKTANVSIQSSESRDGELEIFASRSTLDKIKASLGLEQDSQDSIVIGNAKVVAGYKARPLNGVWATAPYLHNGSVLTLAELLKPAAQRKATFHVGSQEFDPVNVGFVDDPQFPTFDTSRTGNSNAGHEFGASLTEAEKADLIEYLKSL